MVERHPPARPGRHRHRQVARLPRAGAAPRQPGRGRHRDPRAAAPAGRARHPAAGRGGRRPARRRRVVRRAQGPLQLRLPAPHPRRRARRPGHPDRGAAGLDGHQGARAARVGRGGGRGQGQRRARQRAAAHRPRVAPGLGQPPRVPRRGQVPVRPGVLRRAGPREGPALPPDRHQPLAARDRRDRGRADDPGLRRRGRRRGPRAGQPGSPRPRPTSCSPPTSTGPPSASQRHVEGTEADDLADAGDALRAAIDDSRPGRIDTLPDALGDALVAGARQRPGLPLGLPQGRAGRQATATPGSPRPRARCRRCSRPPSGWPPTPRATCSG